MINAPSTIKFRDPEHSEAWYAERDKQREHEKELAKIAAAGLKAAAPTPKMLSGPPEPTQARRSPESAPALQPERPIAAPAPLKLDPVAPLDPDERVISVVERADMELRDVEHEHRAKADSGCARCRQMWVSG
jgi:hypothetical protein